MDLKQQIDKLFTDLSSYYFEKEFEYKSETNTFFSRNSEVFWMIEHELPDYIIFKPVLISKEKEVSTLLEKMFPSSPAIVTQKTQGYNLAHEFGYGDKYLALKDENSSRDKGKSYKVTALTDTDEIINDHRQYMESIGHKFLEQLSSLQGIHNFINLKILEGSIEFFLSADRQKELKKFIAKREILSGLITAYLLKSKDTKEIIRRLRSKYKDKGPVIREMEIINTEFKNFTPTIS